MWESPTTLWRRLNLGREEYIQRLVTTLILDGDPPPWNTPRSPGDSGRRFLQLLDEAAHGTHSRGPSTGPLETFIDEYLLPKLEDDAANGWPDWAVLGPARVWIIELKTEAGSHRSDQLPYYLRLAAAAHPNCSLDLTYITGRLAKPAPTLLDGQRYSHLTWDKVLPLIEGTWGDDTRPEVAAYMEMLTMLVSNLGELRPSEQRQMVVGQLDEVDTGRTSELEVAEKSATPRPAIATSQELPDVIALARATATDGHQRAVGAKDPEDLEALHDRALAEIGSLGPDDATRFVLPWLWDATRTGGRAVTAEGEEFGYELRFSRYKKLQVRA
ncbi:hypothetical protein [Nocardioides zhouii]|uniref:Uncharacterized protein n=1 Tax=Nocardioides zhouii TaxID=1168729 RepID=A0A4Q2SJJ1_9ACTN|nr:hypothetical protein [Nocardioides zhouii]RYC05746.1 hypothetical protein EUA94_17760 [Nocardioides zhouii]